ncbi:MAG: GTP-binding protein [Candidatus Heimdallarchaeota archaeon]|nr:GTP-binding protein [Candidatus Heimdallarchaeota archaeon]MCK4954315.1 GTP-binding protein [Candidatus Heimdallarchaeota archaeon]
MTLSPNITYIIKIINIGDYSVGKTSLAVRYTQNRFTSSYLPTLGVDFHSKNILYDEDTTLRLVLFDTVGQEKLVALRKRYYTGAHGAVVVFDVTRKDSFDHIRKWIEEVEEKCPDIPIIIVGNKTDLIDQRAVTKEEVEAKWTSKGYTVLESSAKMGEGVDDIYTIIAKKVMEKQGY